MACWSITTASGWRCKNTPLISELLPEPATPVTTVSTPGGMSTSTLRRLCRLARRIGRLPLGSLNLDLRRGLCLSASAVRVSAVSNCSGVPWNTTLPSRRRHVGHRVEKPGGAASAVRVSWSNVNGLDSGASNARVHW
jgi:hypothetical protein